MTDQEFEDFLEGRSRVTEGYDRLRVLEPPTELDRIVLREARAAAARAGPRRTWSWWFSRVATAAVVVVAVGVALQLDPDPLRVPVERAAPVADAPEAAEGFDVGLRSVRPATTAVGPRAAGDSSSGTRRRPVREHAEESPGTAVLPDEQAALRRESTPYVYTGRSADSFTDDEGRLTFPGVIAISPEGRRVAALRDELRMMGMTRPGLAQPVEDDERTDPADRRLDALGRDLEAAEQALARNTPLYRSLFARLARDRDLADPEDQAEIVADFEEASTYAADRSMPTGSSEPSAAAQPEWQAFDPPSPAAWLALIGALGDTGDASAARRELIAFRAAWPGHALPPEYADLLEE